VTPAMQAREPLAEASPERHVVSAVVVDRPGTLNRISGLLRARSFNIDSLTVATTHEPGRSRMTIVVHGDDGHLHQVLAQLERLIEVIEVDDLTHVPRIELELALVALAAPADTADRSTVRQAIDLAGGELLDTGGATWQLRLLASPDRIEEALGLLRGLGLRSLVRAGAVAMATAPTTAPTTRPTTHPQIGAPAS